MKNRQEDIEEWSEVIWKATFGHSRAKMMSDQDTLGKNITNRVVVESVEPLTSVHTSNEVIVPELMDDLPSSNTVVPTTYDEKLANDVDWEKLHNIVNEFKRRHNL